MDIVTIIVIICGITMATCCLVGLVDMYFLISMRTSNIYRKYNIGLYVLALLNVFFQFLAIFVNTPLSYAIFTLLLPFLVYLSVVAYFFEVNKLFDVSNTFWTRRRITMAQITYIVVACLLFFPRFITKLIIPSLMQDETILSIASVLNLLLIVLNAVMAYVLNFGALYASYLFSARSGNTPNQKKQVKGKLYDALYYLLPQMGVFTIGVIIYLVNNRNPCSTEEEVALDYLAGTSAKGIFVIALFLYIRSFEKIRELVAFGVHQGKSKVAEAENRDAGVFSATRIMTVDLSGTAPSPIATNVLISEML